MTRRLIRDIAFDAWEAALAALVAVAALEVSERGFVARFFSPSWLILFAFVAALVGLAAARGAEERLRARTSVAVVALIVPLAAWLLLGGVALKWRIVAAVISTLAAAIFWRALSSEEKN
jgi:hypothetical protein